MHKVYKRAIHSCSQCPNLLIVPPISYDILSRHERRCKAVVYRRSVFRLIHDGHEPHYPTWCPLKDEEEVPLPF